MANLNAMATTAESSTDHCSPHTNISQPVELYDLSQTDLYNLSLSSPSATHCRREASVAPKIDRSVFNESAGSRRQTYARLRLLPRNKQPPASAKAFRIPPRIPETVDEENSQIISLLQGLFGVESLRNANANREGGGDEDGLVPVQVEFNHSLPESSAVEFQRIPIDVVDTGQRKRKRGRPRKNENYGIIIKEEPRKVDAAAIPPPPPAPVIVNEKGFAVDVVGLGEVGDPFGEEVKRRTQGLETQEQLLEFLEGLNGEWGSQRKKRRIVPASDLGDLLPAGWKIVLSLQRRAGRASVICRRYVRFFSLILFLYYAISALHSMLYCY